MNVYDIGDQIKCAVAFLNESGVAADPTSVTGRFVNPSGGGDTYVYGTDAELVKASTGNYYFYVPVPLNRLSRGVWAYRFESTDSAGAALVAEEEEFEVRASVFYP